MKFKIVTERQANGEMEFVVHTSEVTTNIYTNVAVGMVIVVLLLLCFKLIRLELEK